MTYTTPRARAARRTDRPFNPGRRHRADFARQATIDAFGWHFARALDQADFVDRKPRLIPIGLIAGRIVQRLVSAHEARHAP